MPDMKKVISCLHCKAKDLMIDLPACDECNYQIQLDNRRECDFRQLCRDAAALLEEHQPKKGHWEKSEYASDRWHKCSECGTTTERVDKNGYKLICNFCRICGADMRGEQKRRNTLRERR